MVQVVYHIGAIIYRVYVKRYRMSMLPTLFDMKNAWTALLYNLHLSKKAPQQGRYTFEEKAEYWALVWGNLVMIITGFMLWNPLATTRMLPGEFIPAAKSAHGNEALLAVLAIIIWHLYHVLIKTVNRSMFNGYLTEEQMLHEHPLEVADLKAGIATPPVNKAGEAKRKAIFWPVYGIIGALLLVGIYAFVTFEQTAVSQRPSAEEVEVFVPLTATPLPTLPPTATPAPTEAGATAPTTWDGGIASLFNKCEGCHGSSGGLNLESYQSAVAGGNSGPGIVSGNPDTSQVVIVQETGSHPGQFSPEELDVIRQWIAAGAPEN
jgi:cytochrome b subunit of formate dehydrogenase